jgi:hypothetical protein
MALTYSNRSNARRAALQAGLDRDRLEIIAHKSGDEVRFAWREKIPVVREGMSRVGGLDVLLPAKIIHKNGIKRPKAGGVCADIWKWFDLNPNATMSDVKIVGIEMDWNVNTLKRQYYEYRKFYNHIQ